MTATTDTTIELIYFDGCPNADAARSALRAVAGAGAWTEWNLSDPDTPERYRSHGSPTVLVGGRDVRGSEGGTDAMACRADGAPTADEIRRALDGDTDGAPGASGPTGAGPTGAAR
ncbi:MAG: hypothetical protein RQ751_14125 [Longimicrobiales bacterium]|nr:hypothetical protein [Longimicrobiales bacterium]